MAAVILPLGTAMSILHWQRYYPTNGLYHPTKSYHLIPQRWVLDKFGMLPPISLLQYLKTEQTL
jgi:hypothetical protein